MSTEELHGVDQEPLKSKLDAALDELEKEGQAEVEMSEQGLPQSGVHKALGEIRLSAVENIRKELKLMRNNLERAQRPSQPEAGPVMPDELRD